MYVDVYVPRREPEAVTPAWTHVPSTSQQVKEQGSQEARETWNPSLPLHKGRTSTRYPFLLERQPKARDGLSQLFIR